MDGVFKREVLIVSYFVVGLIYEWWWVGFSEVAEIVVVKVR